MPNYKTPVKAGLLILLLLCILRCQSAPSVPDEGGKTEETREPVPSGAQVQEAETPSVSAPASATTTAPTTTPTTTPTPGIPEIPESGAVSMPREILAGTNEGLFSVDTSGRMTALWSGGSIRKILALPADAATGSAGQNTWAILGSEGILVSTDLRNWEKRNQGLPVKTVKVFQNGSKSFVQMVQEIKDLEVNPANPNIMVCATKDHVYLSRNQGRAWVNLGAPPYRTNGIKAVAAAFMPDLTVFLSHSTYGIYYLQPDRGGTQWIEMGDGIETLETTDNPDEVSDMIVMTSQAGVEMYVSQTFRRRIYRLDWEGKKFSLIWSDNSPFGTVDSLHAGKTGLDFLCEGTVASIGYANPALRKRQDIAQSIQSVTAHGKLNCIAIRDRGGGDSDWLTLSELWLLDEQEPDTLPKPAPTRNINARLSSGRLQPFYPEALGKEGLYLPVNHAMDSASLRPYLDTINRSGLNMIVIDMKDDYGRLRFTPKNPAITAKGRVFRPLDIEALLRDMKARGIYTVARIVVFKDPELAAKENGRFAVWDTKNAEAWVGYDRSGEPYDERWVDPYSEEVWEYNAATAAELHERGFDEIQFDYIRFPTDGVNLGDARFRWQENGMDRETAILSFLRHIRSRVKAPISIDIYGANGWYRTGARTGQEVELLAPWVDVICPMYYPSHFEQHFLAQNPPEMRPWRIYYHGTLRTARIGRGQVIIRPYVQAFYLNVSYDRKYYNEDYVRYQVEATRTAGNGGLTYWNNSGRYADIPDK